MSIDHLSVVEHPFSRRHCARPGLDKRSARSRSQEFESRFSICLELEREFARMTYCKMSRALFVQMNGPGVAVVMRDVLVDCGYRFGHAAEHAAAQRIGGGVAHEALDHVQSGCRGWREVHVGSRLIGQPLPRSRMLVCGVVVGDHVRRLAFGRLAIHLAQELQPLGVGWPSARSYGPSATPGPAQLTVRSSTRSRGQRAVVPSTSAQSTAFGSLRTTKFGQEQNTTPAH